MTTRLNRWLGSLDAFEKRIAQVQPVRRYGRLTRATAWCWKRPAYSCRWVRPA